jgi:hypothetical protein
MLSASLASARGVAYESRQRDQLEGKIQERYGIAALYQVSMSFLA